MTIMKILIDEMDDGLDEKLCEMGYEAYSVKKLITDGAKMNTDYSVLNYARDNDMILVTRDVENGKACAENNMQCILIDRYAILDFVIKQLEKINTSS